MIRVAVVDVQPLMVSAFAALIRAQPDMLVVGTGANGQEALRLCEHTAVDVLVMDVRMPVMDGLEAVKLIRSSGKHDAGTVPIVAMTANAMREDRESSKEAGMNGHIAKPIDMAELKSALYEQLHGRQGTGAN